MMKHTLLISFIVINTLLYGIDIACLKQNKIFYFLDGDKGCINKINCKNCGKVTFTEYSCNYKCDRCKEYKKKYKKELGDLWKFNHTDRMLSGYCFDCGYKIRNSEDGKIWTIDEYLNDNGRSLEEENQEKSEDAEVNPYHEPKDIKIDNNGIWDYEPPMTIEYDNNSNPYYIPNY